MIEHFDILGGRPCLFADLDGMRTLVPLTFGLAAARAAVPRLLGLGDDELANRCLPRSVGAEGSYWFGWGRA
jgi:hypothetical protein